MAINAKAEPTEADLLQAIKDAPEDDAPRLAYADALVAADHPRGWWMRGQIDAADETKPTAARTAAQDRDAPFFRDVVAISDQRARADLLNERVGTLGFETPPAPLGQWTMTLQGASAIPDDDVSYELVYARGMLAGIDLLRGQLRDLPGIQSVLGRAAIRLFGATIPLLHAYAEAGALADIHHVRVRGPVATNELDPLLRLPLLRSLDLSDALLDDVSAIQARVSARPDTALVLPSAPTRRCRVSLAYRLVRDGEATPQTQEKTWFFELPRAWATAEGFRDLLHRIFFDANAVLRAREPNDHAHLALDTFDFTPIDAAEMLAWDGATTMEAATRHLPWIVAHQRIVWEPAACFIVDENGRYDGMTGNDFSELIAYRALEEAVTTEPAALAFIQKLYPGSGPAHGRSYFEDRAARLRNLLVVRATPGRRTPNQRPCVSRLPHLDIDGTRAIVHGSGGSYRFPNTFGPGTIGADPYGGPGGRIWSVLDLYERNGSEIVLVDTIVEDIYGPVEKHEVWVSHDGGRAFRLSPDEKYPPRGPDVVRLAHVSLEHPTPRT